MKEGKESSIKKNLLFRILGILTGFLLFTAVLIVTARQIHLQKRAESIRTYQNFAVSEYIRIETSEYLNGMLTLRFSNDSEDHYFIEDKWVEYQTGDTWKVLREEKIPDDDIVYGFMPDSQFSASWGEDAQVHYLMKNETTLCIKILRENLDEYYNGLKEGEYRIFYLIRNDRTDERELVSGEFSVAGLK